jgi:hypothetical protein
VLDRRSGRHSVGGPTDHLAHLGALLQAGRDIHGITGDEEELAVFAASGDSLTPVFHADARGPAIPRARRSGPVIASRIASAARTALGVVVVRRGTPNTTITASPMNLLDGAHRASRHWPSCALEYDPITDQTASGSFSGSNAPVQATTHVRQATTLQSLRCSVAIVVNK